MKSSCTGFRRLFKADKLLSQPVTPENDGQLGHLAPARGKLAARAASIAYLSVGISHGKRALSYAHGRRVREAPLWSRAKSARSMHSEIGAALFVWVRHEAAGAVGRDLRGRRKSTD